MSGPLNLDAKEMRAVAHERAAECIKLRTRTEKAEALNADLLEALKALVDDAIHHEDGDDRSMTIDITIGRAEEVIARAETDNA